MEERILLHNVILFILCQYFPNSLLAKENTVIVGIDEAGRGPLAGPVVAGACVLNPLLKDHPLIRDSKVLTPEERQEAFAWIQKNCITGYGIAENIEIDTIGILASTEKAMQQAVSMIADFVRPTYLLIDGRDKFWFDYPHSSIIEGDSKEPCISAASIVAKVIRDRLMMEHAKTYPRYGFEQHKGYGSPLHIEALQMFGPCPLHRQTFLTRILSAEASGTVQGQRQ